MTSLQRIVVWLVLAMALCPAPSSAQDAPRFKPEELEQLVAPVALHPDPLLVQVLMASTYPLEVVQAARFVKDNPNLKGDQLNEALKQHQWDDSVKSLTTFPQVLTMMNDKLDWLQKLGDAFLGQQQELMAAVQRLRARAHESGQLKNTAQQNVVVEPAAAVPAAPPPGAAPPASAQAPAAPAPAGQAAAPFVQAQPAPATVQVQQAPATVQVVQAPPTVIKIEPANPQVVAVPSYDPMVVYGAWPYPAYPPYYPYPPGYFAAGAMMFGAGVAVGAALWGDADWNGGEVNINNSNANNFSNNVNNSNEARNRVEHRNKSGGSGTGGQNRGKWQHNPEHRKGVQYRDKGTQQRFNKTGPANAQSREAFRGRSGQGGDFNRAAQQGGLGQQGRGQAGVADRAGGGQSGIGADRAGGVDRGAAQASPRSGGFGQGGGQGRQPGAFEGMSGGRDTQSFSNRGRESRESFNRSSGGSRSGGGGGGGSRGGGGGGGGGRSGGGGRGGGGGRR
ncbi:MAG TPA: DUF3300 domain-containing protein [Methylomirabilota bacterium]|jgi:hypothetical protein